MYVKDEGMFFKEFLDVVSKFFELGVPFTSGQESRLRLKRMESEA